MRLRAVRALGSLLKALLVVLVLAAPLQAGMFNDGPSQLLDTLRRRVQDIRGYAVTIHYTKRKGDRLKQNVIRYESRDASQNIRIRYLKGDRAGVEAVYTASQHKVQVRIPYLPITLSLNPDDLGGDRRIYETDLSTIVQQLQGPGWEIKDFNLDESLGWPAWALTIVNRYLGQRVVLMVDRRQWLPRRIERFKSNTSDYEIWRFEDYHLDLPPDAKSNGEVLFSNNG